MAFVTYNDQQEVKEAGKGLYESGVAYDFSAEEKARAGEDLVGRPDSTPEQMAAQQRAELIEKAIVAIAADNITVEEMQDRIGQLISVGGAENTQVLQQRMDDLKERGSNETTVYDYSGALADIKSQIQSELNRQLQQARSELNNKVGRV